MESNQKLHEKLNQFLNEASPEEKDVLTQVLKGMREKRNGEYNTYITSFMQTKTEMTDDELIMTIPVSPFLHNSVDIVHGGFTATLADTAMGTFVNQKIPVDQVAVTAEMKLNYTAPGIGDYLKCTAKFLHLGTKTSVTEAKVYNDKGTLVAIATGSFYIITK